MGCVNLMMTSRLAQILLAIVACLLPTPWISLPAAGLLVLWFPGRCLPSLLPGLENLRRSVWPAVAASMVLMPVVLSWVWHVANGRWVVLACVGLVDIALALLEWRWGGPPSDAPPRTPGRSRWLLDAMVGWTAGCILLSFWLPRLTGNVTITGAHDYIKHHAVMLSLERHPLPLHNCFYKAEADTPYYYYEYYYLLPAALRTMTGNRVSIALAFGLTSALLAAALIRLIFLLARDILGSERGALLSAACISVVGGFDVVPVLIRAATGAGMVITLDAWAPVAWRIHNFTTQYFWCPQHVYVVLGLTLAAAWLRQAPGRAWWVAMAPLLGASVLGGSAHLALVIFPAVVVYVIHHAVREGVAGRVRVSRMLAGAWFMCVLGTLLMGSQAWGYQVMSARYPGGLTAAWERYPFALVGRLLPPGPLANYADAPWVLVVELGLPALACLLVAGRFWRLLWADAGARLLMLSGLVGAVLMFTIRSDVNAIDYGFRIAPMAAAPLLVIVAGALLDVERVRPGARSWVKGALTAGIVMGLPVGLYEAPMAAVRSLWESRPMRAEAGAIRWLRCGLPTDAVVQGDPQTRLNLAALTDRQIGVLNPDSPHVVVFAPRDPARMRRAYSAVLEAFSTSSAAVAHADLDAWGVEYVLVGMTERAHFGTMPQFEDRSWFEQVYNDGFAAVYRLVRTVPPSRPPVETSEGRP